MKDAKGHGSDPRDAAHQAARRLIQAHPDDKNPQAEEMLRSIGYKDIDLQRLRALAGAAVKEPAAHQSGIEVARSIPRVSLDPGLLRKAAGV